MIDLHCVKGAYEKRVKEDAMHIRSGYNLADAIS